MRGRTRVSSPGWGLKHISGPVQLSQGITLCLQVRWKSQPEDGHRVSPGYMGLCASHRLLPQLPEARGGESRGELQRGRPS